MSSSIAMVPLATSTNFEPHQQILNLINPIAWRGFEPRSNEDPAQIVVHTPTYTQTLIK
jgi:hypothetical protein